MLFSIVTICKDDKKRLLNTLNSVYSQTCKDYEHIIEDGGSKDGTIEAIKDFCHNHNDNNICTYIENDNGIYDAMNRAVTKAKGEYICFLNAGDDFVDQLVLEKVKDNILSEISGDIFYGSAIVVFPDKVENSQVIAYDENKLCSEEVLKSADLHLIHQALFAKRLLFDVNKFNCDYLLRAELDWYYQCISSGKSFVKLPFPICRYSLGGMSENSYNAELNVSETKRILDHYGYTSGFYVEKNNQAQLARGIYRYIYNEWLTLKLSGYSMEKYLLKRRFNNIAIFGYGELGCHVINELKNCNINIRFIVESDERFPYSGIPLIKPDQLSNVESIDVIIVTAIMHYKEILKMYKNKVICPMISLENILEDMWE